MSRNDKALSAAALELTQKMQTHFPREISPAILGTWNSLPAENLRSLLLQLFGAPPVSPNELLIKLGEVTIPESATHHLTAYFGLLFKEKAVHRVGEGFSRHFLIESVDTQPAATLSCFRLTQELSDIHLVDVLGGKSSIVSHPSAMTHLMRLAGRGRNEWLDLRNAAQNNLFFFSDKEGTTWAVFLGIFDSGWTIDAIPLHRDFWYPVGTRIFIPKRTA